jgi:NADPH:quinone reductase-like Zn-dependent oxidoreductase
MKAARIHRFGGPEVIRVDEVSRPLPGPGEVLVRVAVAGVGPWDALIREGKSVLNLPLPLTLGSDLSGVVEGVGEGVTEFGKGDEIYGVTNQEFIGAYAEYALASVATVAHKPKALDFAQAASVPVVAVTARQMLFDYANLLNGQTILIHGAAGNVGAYLVQLAKQAGVNVFATAGPADFEYVRGLGADTVIDKAEKFEKKVPLVDAVLDTVGGETRERSFSIVRQGGIVVSVQSPFPEGSTQHPGIRSVFFLVEVTTARLNLISELFDSGKLSCQVGTVLPLVAVRNAHEMLAGAPHKRGKIVLKMAS